MKIDTNKIIDRLGGTGAVAVICDITDGSVSNWRKNGIPKPWVKFLRAQHPDVFEAVQPNEGDEDD